jgi:hypothetical protein
MNEDNILVLLKLKRKLKKYIARSDKYAKIERIAGYQNPTPLLLAGFLDQIEELLRGPEGPFHAGNRS